MQDKFYVSHETQQMGPYSVDEIVAFVQSGTLSPLDYIYDESMADWILFMDHPALSDRVRALKPKTPPKTDPKDDESVKHKNEVSKKVVNHSSVDAEIIKKFDHEWFVLKGENKFGPFSYVDVVKMLQQGVVYEFDFAWYEGMQGWTRVADLPAFSHEQLKLLKHSAVPEINDVFFRRRYKRVKYGGTILVHDNAKVWKGHAVEISQGGAGVIMENALILPGQELYLHFKPGDGVPPFNAVCEVVSKQYVSGVANTGTPIKYGLKFKAISAETEKVIKEYTKGVA